MTTNLKDRTEEAATSRSVVDRALTILGTFSADCERQSLSELSRRSGLPAPTAYRLVQRLSAWGALERDQDGAYRIGIRLWEIGALVTRPANLQHVARPFMHDLHEMTRFNVHLAIREGSELVSVEHFYGSSRTGRKRRFVGQRHVWHPTAIALVLLAHAPLDVREEVLSTPWPRFTPHTCVDPLELVRVLTQIRDRGYAVSDRQIDLRHTGVAAPVRGPDGTVIAALSLVCEHGTAPVKSMIHVVRIAASGISRALREAAHPAASTRMPPGTAAAFAGAGAAHRVRA